MSKLKRIFAPAIVAFALANTSVMALDPGSVPVKKRTSANLYLAASEVPAFLKSNNGRVLFLDVRTPAELISAGSAPLIDANDPVMIEPAVPGTQLEPNPDFTAWAGQRLAAKGLSKSDPVVLICRSGSRSALAANLLTEAGFAQVYSVADGFEGSGADGWKKSGLPWGFELDQAKLPPAGLVR
jgi:rhodanese-related sulfurtransferase